jgi:UDP-glucose 4-epimerase|tara:strand:- start:9110 stop:10078 length:969 start_codon:yes stop_codon:yes gene_type:complete
MNRPQIKNNTILVTGGAGFIGSHLVDRLLKEEAEQVIIVDNMFLGNEDNLKGAFKQGAILYKDDCEIYTSLEYIFDKHNIDIVFNCATKPLNYTFLNPSNGFQCNTNIIINLLELQRKEKFKTLVHFSTSEVYGTAVYEPMDENHPLHPKTTYAAGKVGADKALEAWVDSFNLDAFIVRPFNNYGPRQNPNPPLAAVIPVTMFNILNNNPPEIWGNGSQSRDFIYVHDTIDAIVKVYNKLKPKESINISTDGQISIKEVIENICSIIGYDTDNIIYKPIRKADVECHAASNDKIKSLINYQLTPFSKGLKETINWYLKNLKP